MKRSNGRHREDPVDREIARRRAELVAELRRSRDRIRQDLVALAAVCARRHPIVYLASGVAVGACATGFARRASMSALVAGAMRVFSVGKLTLS